MKPETMIGRLRHLLAVETAPNLTVGRKLLVGALEVLVAQRDKTRRLKEALEAAGWECAEIRAERDAAVAEIKQQGAATGDLCGLCAHCCACDIKDDVLDEEWPECFEWRGPGAEA